jgi:DNA-binding transcriptional LysR family regulator
VVQAVLDNLSDFGITQLPVQEKKLQVVKIYSDEIKLLVPAGHRLASYERINARDLLGEQLLLPKTGTTRVRLNTWLDAVQEELNVSMELDSTEMIKRFVMANLGISFLAASHCREEVAVNKLACVSLGPEPMIRRVGLIYRRDKSLSKAALGFIQVTLENAGNEIGMPSGQRLRALGT